MDDVAPKQQPVSLALDPGSGPSHHTRFLAGSIIITFGFRFSVHTAAAGRTYAAAARSTAPSASLGSARRMDRSCCALASSDNRR
jgi:hypothetical protein